MKSKIVKEKMTMVEFLILARAIQLNAVEQYKNGSRAVKVNSELPPENQIALENMLTNGAIQQHQGKANMFQIKLDKELAMEAEYGPVNVDVLLEIEVAEESEKTSDALQESQQGSE